MPVFPSYLDELRELADQADAQALIARARAQRLLAALGQQGWQGRAAEAFHSRAREVVGAWQGAAVRLDEAADLVRTHANRAGRAVKAPVR